MKEATSSTSPETPYARWIFVIARLLRNKNVCLELFSPSSWSAQRVAVCGTIARTQGRPSNWINEERQLTLALIISEPALPWDYQRLLRPSPSGHRIRLRIQTPPSANPISPAVWLCFLAAVRQHHDSCDQRAPRGPVQNLCRQRCAGRAAGGESSCCLWSLLLVSAGIRRCACCGFARVPSGSTVLGQVYCPSAFNMPQVFTARILTAFCARAFYTMLQMSPLSPAQTFRLLWI